MKVYRIRTDILPEPKRTPPPKKQHWQGQQKFRNWARCLPNWGNVLTHHGQRACPCWADLLSE